MSSITLQFYIPPCEIRVLHYMIRDGCMEVFHWLAKLSMRHYRPPQLLGGTWHSDHHDILAHGEHLIVILSMEAFWTS